ncbi:hypothetical protein TGAMA5MH_00594 [Trichoderma gamsii]|uniref:Rhodopsin domain-containing protein n=1 Tax=Trichoderma gamsii TaxID=398673 RepID=A0A2K0TS26_9HYPO|nr:hypothetical protein TGAMA5MH_00594 [Trichoderma gamsii]
MVIKSLQEDDWLMLVAQLIFTLSCIFIFNGIHSGMGRHNAAVTDGDEQATALMALLPIPMLWSVKMTPQAKATVIIILGLGIFASVATLIRIRYLTVMKDLDDLLFAATQVMTWTVIEPGVAIIAASLATIRPLLRAWRVHGFLSTGRSRTAHSAPSAYARQTTENRSTPVIDQIFGPDDVSLKSVQPNYETVPPETSMSTIGLTIEQAQASTLTVSRLDVEQARSHAGQGKGRTPSRSVITEASHKTNSSLFDDLNGLEAQSQEGGY